LPWRTENVIAFLCEGRGFPSLSKQPQTPAMKDGITAGISPQ
jgi:hypothetical protein